MLLEKVVLLLLMLIALMPKPVHAWAWLLYIISLKICQAILMIFLPTPSRQPSWLRQIRRWRKRKPTSATEVEKAPSSSSSSKEEEALARLLIWDVVILIAHDIHYADIISLASTSKRIRETVLPAKERQGRLATLRKYTLCAQALSPPTLDCETCGMQTCSVSPAHPPLPPAPAHHHALTHHPLTRRHSPAPATSTCTRTATPSARPARRAACAATRRSTTAARSRAPPPPAPSRLRACAARAARACLPTRPPSSRPASAARRRRCGRAIGRCARVRSAPARWRALGLGFGLLLMGGSVVAWITRFGRCRRSGGSGLRRAWARTRCEGLGGGMWNWRKRGWEMVVD